MTVLLSTGVRGARARFHFAQLGFSPVPWVICLVWKADKLWPRWREPGSGGQHYSEACFHGRAVECCMMLKGPFQEDVYILKYYSFGWQSYCPFSKSYSHTVFPFGQMLSDQGEERFSWDFSQCRTQKLVKLGASLHYALIIEDPSEIWLVDFVLRAKFKPRHHGVIVHHKSCALRWEFYSRVDLKWERCRRKIPTRI